MSQAPSLVQRQIPPAGQLALARGPVKPLIDPLWEREWLKGSSAALLLFGVLGFLGGTVVLPLSLEKPADMGVIGIIGTITWAVQTFTGLAVVAEWPLNKKAYQSILIALLVMAVPLGFGDLANIVAFGAPGGVMFAIRLMADIALVVAMVVASNLKKIPLD